LNETVRAGEPFRLGDVRGIYPSQVNESFAYDFARAFAIHFRLRGIVATGRDMRASSASLQQALNDGFAAAGVTVRDLSLCATELGYFASTRPGVDAAVVVTASHNPPAFNGFKCVLANGVAVTFDSGLNDIRRVMAALPVAAQPAPTVPPALDLMPDYMAHVAATFPVDDPFDGRIALNGLNGTAATLAGRIATAFSIPVDWYRKEPGPIPDEGADPTNPRLRSEMKGFMAGRGYALGVAWDGDCDRCVFFDGNGELMPTYYIIGLLAAHFLDRAPGRAVVYDTKLAWNTLDVIQSRGGIAVPSETGHAFMKRHMKESGAIYGGELSSHHYFGDFFGCDSGMFAWLTLLRVMREARRPVADLVDEQRARVQCTPEISIELHDADRAFDEVRRQYEQRALAVDPFDGLAFTMPGDWRFSLRKSKTESKVRVNFECRGNTEAMLDGGAALFDLFTAFKADASDWHARLAVH